MMLNLLRRADAIAREAERRAIGEVARQLRATLEGASVDVDEARVLVEGRGLTKRLLLDPGVRLLLGRRR